MVRSALHSLEVATQQGPRAEEAVRRVQYPESRVGHGRTVQGHARRSACVASGEQPCVSRGPGGEELDMRVGPLVERGEPLEARSDEEILEHFRRTGYIEGQP